MTKSRHEYGKRVVAKYSAAFAAHTELATSLESALLQKRAHPTLTHLVIDMLMVQGHKTHAAVSILCQHGLFEDTATLTRRLLELSVQAVYVCFIDDDTERLKRAGRFGAYLWKQLDHRVKHRLPVQLRREWACLRRDYGRQVSTARWGPNFRAMFKEVGKEDLYLSDYKFLSSLAHGSGEVQVFQFATPSVRVHRDDFVPTLLSFSSRYYLAIAEPWKALFGTLDAAEFDRLERLVFPASAL